MSRGLDRLELRDVGPVAGMCCPRCSGGLGLAGLEVQLGDDVMTLADCAACRGVFFRPGELESFLKTAQSVEMAGALPVLGELEAQIAAMPRAEETSGRHYIGCPVCKMVMLRTIFGRESGVVIDSCRDHGVWLDGGELEAIAGWWHAGGEVKAKYPVRRKAEAFEEVGEEDANWSDYDGAWDLSEGGGWMILKEVSKHLMTRVPPYYIGL